MRGRSLWMLLVLLVGVGGNSRAEVQQVAQNLFLSNDGLFARGADGTFRQFVFDSGAHLVFGSQPVADSSPTTEQVLGFYCRNLGRVVSSSLRFRFFVRAIA